MIDGRYAKYVQPMRLGTEVSYAPGTGVMAPGNLAPVIYGTPAEALRSVGQHSHNDSDEAYFFYETDPADNTRLGGEIEMWLGHGADAHGSGSRCSGAVDVGPGTP